MRLRSGSATDVGQLRSVNQDSILTGATVCAVADGMGGHQGGEVASALTVEVLRDGLAAPTVDALIELVRRANREVWDRGREDPDLAGMGTTVVALAPVEIDDAEHVALASVGDSRIYLFRGDDLLQVSEDHSLVADMVRAGQLSPEEAEQHPRKNIVTRALGIESDVEVDVASVVPATGDRFLLCSDGLTNEVTEERIASVLRRLDDPGDVSRELVRLANEGGGRDNISVVVVDVVADGGGAAALDLTGTAAAPAHEDPAGFDTALDDDDLAGLDAPVGTGEPAGDGEAPRARFTWRFALTLVVVLGLAGVAAGAVVFAARGGYFVGFDGERVAIYRGEPDGLLWFDPTLDRHTSLERDDLLPSARHDVEEQPTYGSLAAAERFVSNLRVRPGTDPAETGEVGTFDTTTTTSTTTTSTTSTTTSTTTDAGGATASTATG